MPNILAAMGMRLPTYLPSVEVKPPIPLAELILELTDLRLQNKAGNIRAIATARLIFSPPTDSAREVESKRYRFTVPLGSIETDELTWYLERYWRYPAGVYQVRAERVEKQLEEWGQALYMALRDKEATATFSAWERADKHAERRLTVKVEQELPKGSPKKKQQAANEAAALLLALPWELLHNGKEYLFEAARAVRVRRQLPNRTEKKPYNTDPPIRVLLVSPRPEKGGVGYIDHRVIARPLVEALTPLGTLAQLTLLTTPTFEALRDELRRADEADTPYHVVHFDGHGVYDPKNGLGALVFEHHEDKDLIGSRGFALVSAEQIANVVREYRVPLFFLNACQSAMSNKDPLASVAGKLLESGVASVIAMTHSVLVETARRFVTAFYREALKGERVGQAMLKGQQALKDDARRGKTFAGDLRLQDWFVPVLYQEERDPQLVREAPAELVQEQIAKARQLRLGKILPAPPQTFVGRSRELLYAERMLEQQKYAVIVGMGGEGKTTLACELARWLVQTGRAQRAAFVSFEQATTADAALSLIGDQLVDKYQSKAGQGGNRGWLEVERALREEATVIVLDNMESVLKPPDGSSSASAFEPKILNDILKLCGKLQQVGRTRLVFTSREPLPDPFAQNAIPLGPLWKPDALALVAKTLGAGNWLPKAGSEEENEAAIEQLTEAAGYHARALVLLTQEIRRSGVHNATAHFDRLMRDMEQAHPGKRELSLLASVKLSLDRLPAETRLRIRPLGVFQGGGSLTAIKAALQIEDDEAAIAIGQQLVGVGLAQAQEYGYLRFDTALTFALLSELSTEEQAVARDCWARAMQMLARFLYEQLGSDPQSALGLTAWELPNFLAALEHLAGTAETVLVVHFATDVESLAQALGRVRTVVQVGLAPYR